MIWIYINAVWIPVPFSRKGEIRDKFFFQDHVVISPGYLVVNAWSLYGPESWLYESWTHRSFLLDKTMDAPDIALS